MSLSLGFAILSHNEPAQLLRLTRTLTVMFDGPAIACHHDFSQCPLDVNLFSPNVRFVRPHVETRWAHISVSLATLEALNCLRNHANPEWFVFLSGSDYPVRSADAIIKDLSSTRYDAFLGSQPMFETREVRYGVPGWVGEAWDRYCVQTCSVPLPSRDLKFGFLPLRRKKLDIRNPTMVRLILRAKGCPVRIFGGDAWFEANRKAVDRLLAASIHRLLRYFRDRFGPDEALFHTVLCNQKDVALGPAKRYVDWSNGGCNPKVLDMSDVPRMVGSGAHFARKFDRNGVVQDFLDKTILCI
jgi:Core-2/I-Branching enzyme